MAKINLSAPPVFGYEGSYVNAKDARALATPPSEDCIWLRAKIKLISSNAIKILGYCPIAGTIVGVGRLADVIFSHKYQVSHSKKYMAGRIARGAVEALSLGIIFLPIDICVVIHRHFLPVDINPLEIAEVVSSLNNIRQELNNDNDKNAYPFLDLLILLHKEKSLTQIDNFYSTIWSGRRAYKIMREKVGRELNHLENYPTFHQFHCALLTNTRLYVEYYHLLKKKGLEKIYLNCSNRLNICLEGAFESSFKFAEGNLAEKISLTTLFTNAWAQSHEKDIVIQDVLKNKSYWDGENGIEVDLSFDLINEYGAKLYLWKLEPGALSKEASSENP